MNELKFKPMPNATGWFNMRTGETDYLYESPTDYSDYISQDVSAQSLYRLYMETGSTPQEAALKVLRICVGEKP